MHLSRHTSSAASRAFLICVCAFPEIIEGESERVLHRLFDDAKRTKPSIIFLDELDALVREVLACAHNRKADRTSNGDRGGRHVVASVAKVHDPLDVLCYVEHVGITSRD